MVNLYGDDTNNTQLYGTYYDDSIYGRLGDDILLGGDGADFLHGGQGTDAASYTSASGLTVNLGNPLENTGHAAGDTYHGIENLIGSYYRDTLTGDNGNNGIFGWNGDDIIMYSPGSDHIDGGAGIDSVLYTTYDPLFGGNHGNTTQGVVVNLLTGTATYLLMGEYEQDTLNSIEWVYGSNYNDVIVGNDEDNTLLGYWGDDVISAGGGSDFVMGDWGNDTIVGGSGEDVLQGNDGHDTIYSGRDADTIYGGDGNDEIYGEHGRDDISGGSGRDTIVGGTGADIMEGGFGADTFVFESEADSRGASGTDLITDFDREEGDRFDISAIDANSTRTGHQSFTFEGPGSATRKAGTATYEHRIGGDGAPETSIEFHTDNDGVADMVIILEGTRTLLESDFIV